MPTATLEFQYRQRRTFQEALSRMIELMVLHGLLSKGWRPKITPKSSRYIGRCRALTREIVIVLPMACYATDYHLDQLILHEIAHALTNNTGHTPRFREVCKEIGCKTIYSTFKWSTQYTRP